MQVRSISCRPALLATLIVSSLLAACGGGSDPTTTVASDAAAPVVTAPTANDTLAASTSNPPAATPVASTPAASPTVPSTPPMQPPAVNTSAQLAWQPPTTNTDGSSLVALAGYHIYYGTDPAALTRVIDVTNPGLTSYTVGDLEPGTTYFAISAYTTDGVEGEKSAVGSKTIG